MTRRITVFAIVCAVVACATVAQAVPVFYLNTSNSAAGTPGDVALTNVAPSSTGQLFLWVNTDVRLSGIDLELTETGGGIKFTGAEWLNPSNRWALTGTPGVTDSAVTLLQGGAIPLVVGGGVGPGSPGTDAGPAVLLGSINYMANAGGTSQLALKVGSQTIADWDGAAPNVRFGANAPPDVPGGVAGGTDGVGSIQVGGTEPLTPVITPVNLGEVEQSTTIMAQLTASNNPTSWGPLVPTAGTPALAATVNAQGQFSWDPTGSARGPKGSGTVAYSWTTTASNAAGSSPATVAITLTLIPEPATMSLFGLAMVGVLGLVRRRS
jgi:hypothetical protein